MKEQELAVIVGYIMYYDLLSDKINGSFFSKIDRAIEIGNSFLNFYPADYKWIDLDFEETLTQFVNEN